MNMTPPSLELWQTEWCPASHRVRQRLTELGLTYTSRQVPVEAEARTELRVATGATKIPVLVSSGQPIASEESILDYLDRHFIEPPEAAEQRARAAKAKRKELEEACPRLEAATR
jgi:glutathione S-transferase